ncbi:DinB family protein [Neobacillus drentensis]|uniref:DinB family protein n=1 Tax=Neobacillus drentensis TaxID=220684 RepID=UPI0030016D23
MYTSISEFIGEWNQEASSTQKVLDVLTDQSLQQAVSPNDRTLGRIAWHVVASTPEMLNEFGISIEKVENGNDVPSSAKVIADTFRKVSADTMDAVKQQWTDASLKDMKNVFGMDMPKGVTLSLLIKHIIHHRGQMTVLMRQAGLTVPGVYGPAREEWSQMGMEVPAL